MGEAQSDPQDINCSEGKRQPCGLSGEAGSDPEEGREASTATGRELCDDRTPRNENADRQGGGRRLRLRNPCREGAEANNEGYEARAAQRAERAA